MDSSVPIPSLAGKEEMVLLEACRGVQRNCSNVLIETQVWEAAIGNWLSSKEISNKLRRRIKGNRVLRHQMVRIAVSGCPNGCTRPYVADIGLVGTIRPDANSELCTQCGACSEACPDGAITVDGTHAVFDRTKCMGCTKCRNVCSEKGIYLSDPSVVIYLGGKLGRHPRFGKKAFVARSPDEAIGFLDRLFDDYLNNGLPDERLPDFCDRVEGA